MIVRVEKRENPYVCIDKTALNDNSLSWKARGILAYLLSKPNNWKPTIQELQKASPDGEASVRSGLKELEKAGYLVRHPIKDEKGKITRWEHVVYETSQLEQPQMDTPQQENPQLDNQQLDNPHVDFPQVDNRTLINNELISNELKSKEKDIYSLFEYWNDKHIIRHRELTQRLKSSIRARLQHHSLEQLKKAIDNYAFVLESDLHYWTYKWTLGDFMKPANLERFLDENDPITNFRKSNVPDKPKPKKKASSGYWHEW